MSEFETEQVFYPSKDKYVNTSCQLPMFIVHRKVVILVLNVYSHISDCDIMFTLRIKLIIT